MSHLTQKSKARKAKHRKKPPPDFATQKKGHWTKYYVLLKVVPRDLKRSDSFGTAEKRGFTLTFVRYSA